MTPDLARLRWAPCWSCLVNVHISSSRGRPQLPALDAATSGWNTRVPGQTAKSRNYHSASAPSSRRQVSLRQRWPLRAAASTAQASTSMPSPGPMGRAT